MKTVEDAESEVLTYVLQLDAAGLGLGGKAQAIYSKHAEEVRALLMKQQALLKKRGASVADDQEVLAIEQSAIPVWEKCSEELKQLWDERGPR